MLFLAASLLAFGVVSVSADGWTYLGCYTDQRDARALKFNGNIDGGPGAVTVEHCQIACLQQGLPYAGVEYGNECYCDHDIFNNGPAPDGEAGCNMPCAADQTEMCGGPDRLNMYKYVKTTPINSACPAPTTTTITMTITPTATTVPCQATALPTYQFKAESKDPNVNNYYARVSQYGNFYYIYFGSLVYAHTFQLNNDRTLQNVDSNSKSRFGTTFWERNYGSQTVDYIGVATAANQYLYTTASCSVDSTGYLQCAARGTIFQSCPSKNGDNAAGYLQIGTQLKAGCKVMQIKAVTVDPCQGQTT